jgi:hypothetical protein
VRLLAPVEQANTVAAFLLSEIDSERFAPQLRTALERAGADESLVREPDLADAPGNVRRHAVLFDCRGTYLGTWFDELAWSLVALEPDEVLAVRYIDWDYWLEVTGGSRRPTDAAAFFRARGDGEERYAGVGPPLVVARADPSSHAVVVEGHGRLTALALHPEEIPRPLEVILGEGEAIRRWGCY